jgi:hypothetical protein
MVQNHIKKMLSISAIKERQIKTTLRFHLTPVRITHQKYHHQQMLVRMWGKRNPHTLLVGMKTSTTTLENDMEAS